MHVLELHVLIQIKLIKIRLKEKKAIFRMLYQYIIYVSFKNMWNSTR